ncbi:MAG: hypothetical protein KY466_02700 [Gemmatimonadetes bacterium]|nr:hypothetical protein [Gemmatimonadota bacterium]
MGAPEAGGGGARTPYALSWSGGKDSTLALDRARRAGLEVALLFNIYEGNTGRVRFHGVRRELIEAQADSLGLELLAAHTHPDDYEAVFLGVLDEIGARGLGGVVFGNIHLADIRAWYEERVMARGLEHVEPLWGGAPADLVQEFLDRGFRTRIASVDLARGRREWVGAELTPALAARIAAEEDVDPAGERGEYHTFAFDGPLFRHPVAHRVAGTVEMEGHLLAELLPPAS